MSKSVCCVKIISDLINRSNATRTEVASYERLSKSLLLVLQTSKCAASTSFQSLVFNFSMISDDDAIFEAVVKYLIISVADAFVLVLFLVAVSVLLEVANYLITHLYYYYLQIVIIDDDALLQLLVFVDFAKNRSDKLFNSFAVAKVITLNIALKLSLKKIH